MCYTPTEGLSSLTFDDVTTSLSIGLGRSSPAWRSFAERMIRTILDLAQRKTLDKVPIVLASLNDHSVDAPQGAGNDDVTWRALRGVAG